jgi:hypothetical protein
MTSGISPFIYSSLYIDMFCLKFTKYGQNNQGEKIEKEDLNDQNSKKTDCVSSFLLHALTMAPMAVSAAEDEMTFISGETPDGEPAITEVQTIKPTILTIYYVDKDTVG